MAQQKKIASARELNGLPRRNLRLAQIMYLTGWFMAYNNSGSMIACHAPDRSGKQINLPVANLNETRMHSTLTQILRHTPEDALFAATEQRFPDGVVVDIRDNELVPILVTLRELGERWKDDVSKIDQAARTAEREAAIEERHPQTTVAQAMAEAEAKVEPPKPEPPKERPEIVPVDTDPVVSRRPFIAKRSPRGDGTGVGYESPYLVQEIHKSGRKAVVCSVCGFEGKDINGTAVHAARIHGKQERDLHAPIAIPEYGEVKRRDGGLQRRLLAALQEVQDWRTLSEEQVAEAMAQAIRAARDVQITERGEAEEMSPEQVLERITFLLDNGRLSRLTAQFADLEQRFIAEAEARQEAEAARATAETSLHKVQEDLDAVRTLLSSIGQ